MKKVLLSSIIMLGVCGFAVAQSAKSNNKLGKTTTTAPETTTTSASFTTASDEAPAVKQDKTVTAITPSDAAVSAMEIEKRKAATNRTATITNADGTVQEIPAEKQLEMKKAAAAKAPATRKGN